MTNQDKNMIAEFLRQAIEDAEKEGKNYAQTTGDEQNYAYAFGFLSARIRAIAWALED